jgi:HEAT repeat protein
MLIIFSLHSPSILKIEFMLFASLLSLVSSLVAIIYLSMEMLSDVSGLKTSSEKYVHLSQLLSELEGRDSGQMELSAEDSELCILSIDDEKPEVRIAAASALGVLESRNAVNPLLKKLEETPRKDSSVELQKQIIVALGKIGYNKALSAILSLLESLYPDIRKYAAEALGKLGDKRAVDPLPGMLKEKNPELRITAVYALGTLKAPQAISPLISMLDDDNPWVRKCAAEALGKSGDKKAIEVLVNKLNDIDPEVRKIAAGALGILSEYQDFR